MYVNMKQNFLLASMKCKLCKTVLNTLHNYKIEYVMT